MGFDGTRKPIIARVSPAEYDWTATKIAVPRDSVGLALCMKASSAQVAVVSNETMIYAPAPKWLKGGRSMSRAMSQTWLEWLDLVVIAGFFIMWGEILAIVGLLVVGARLW